MWNPNRKYKRQNPFQTVAMLAGDEPLKPVLFPTKVRDMPQQAPPARKLSLKTARK